MRRDGFYRDLAQSFRIVWLVTAAVSGLAVLAPLFLPANFLLHLFPVCAAKAAGSSCAFCGMTMAFVQIGHGDWPGARSANSGSLLLYAALAANFLAAAAYAIMRTTRHANP